MLHCFDKGGNGVAGDWIKMKVELQNHPKVVRILSATGSDKFRVIGGLHAVWAIFDAHSEDGKLHGYTPETMDHVIGWDGFSQAMMEVKWLLYDGQQTLEMPNFMDNNGKSAKRRAEDQKRKRETRKTSPQVVRNKSETSPKKSGLEKRREDNKNPIVPLPDWLDKKAWQDFVEHRQEIKKKLTPQAAQKNLLVLEAHKDRQQEIVNLTCSNGWTGLFPPKGKLTPLRDDLAGAI